MDAFERNMMHAKLDAQIAQQESERTAKSAVGRVSEMVDQVNQAAMSPRGESRSGSGTRVDARYILEQRAFEFEKKARQIRILLGALPQELPEEAATALLDLVYEGRRG